VTPERARAYQRVVRTLREAGPSKLLPDEQERIREAADQLIFTHDPVADDAARAALVDIERLCRKLVESRRWEQERAMRLADDLASCGPALSPELLAA
jgi:hypothetical protein